ncbi:MAG: SIMPL domain-containing protein [Alphaproteobacteria bacterium]|nr:SIMPL domain-containing protein [Alphaproteobacteria bacterium]MBN2779509.1 SIMPL domain-containing protein [Alphaproteobacteria bacterium]
MKKIKLNTTTLIAVLLAVFITFQLTKRSGGDIHHRVQVEGECLKKVSPDKGKVTFVISTLKQDAKAASKATQETYTKLLEMLKASNLENIELETTQYRVDQEHAWENKKDVFKGYRAIMGIEVQTTDIKRLGEVLAKSTAFQNVEANGFSTFVSAEGNKITREACLVESIENARKKADAMARAGGARLGRMISVQENNFGEREPIRMFAAKALMESEMRATPMIETKDQDIHIKVSVEFELR